MSEREYTIKIDGPGLSFEHIVNEKIAKQMMVAVLTGDNIQPNISQSNAKKFHDSSKTEELPEDSTISNAQPELSLREFLSQKEASRNPDKIAAIALYLKQYRKRNLFSKSDIIEGFEMAAEPVPANISRDLRWTLKNGWIAPKTGDNDLYYITSTGQNVVEQKFPSDILKKTSIKTYTRRNTK